MLSHHHHQRCEASHQEKDEAAFISESNGRKNNSLYSDDYDWTLTSERQVSSSARRGKQVDPSRQVEMMEGRKWRERSRIPPSGEWGQINTR